MLAMYQPAGSVAPVVVSPEKDSNNPSAVPSPSPLSSMNGIAPKEPRAI